MGSLSLDQLALAVRGALELVDVEGGISPRRLPQSTLAQRADENIRIMSGLATGVRLDLLTSAATLTLQVSLHRPVAGPEFPASAPTFAVEINGELVDRVAAPVFARRWPDAGGGLVEHGTAHSTVRLHPGGSGSTERPVTVWLPHDAEVVIHGMEADAPLRVASPDRRPVWLHHGSSISHALEAPGPFGPWPQRAARQLGLDLTNLSLAGQAVLDQAVARAIAATRADLITLKLGINVINSDGFSERTFGPAVHGFLDTIRAAQPSTPIVLITAVSCPIHEHTPGPTIAGPDGRAMAMPRERHPRDGRLTLSRTRELLTAVAESRADDRLLVLDGRRLFGPDDSHHLRDNLHPDLAGNDLIGERFVAIARDRGSVLAQALAFR